MARFRDRKNAIALRKAGKSFTYIRELLKISKGTLHSWIKDIPLSNKQLKKIRVDAKTARIENYIKTTRERRYRIFQQYLDQERKRLLPLTKRDFLIAGFFLYLGEGSKSGWWTNVLTNSDPSIIKFWVFWLEEIIRVNKKKIKVSLHLYRDMDVENEINFWQKVTGFSQEQFRKPYIKKTLSSKINHPTFGHGTCQIILGNVQLKHRILASIKVVLEEAGVLIEKGV